MDNILYVFWAELDRDEYGILIEGHGTSRAQSLTFEDAWAQFGRGEMTRTQLRQDLVGQAMVLIEAGEHRCTTNSL